MLKPEVKVRVSCISEEGQIPSGCILGSDKSSRVKNWQHFTCQSHWLAESYRETSQDHWFGCVWRWGVIRSVISLVSRCNICDWAPCLPVYWMSFFIFNYNLRFVPFSCFWVILFIQFSEIKVYTSKLPKYTLSETCCIWKFWESLAQFGIASY